MIHLGPALAALGEMALAYPPRADVYAYRVRGLSAVALAALLDVRVRRVLLRAPLDLRPLKIDSDSRLSPILERDLEKQAGDPWWLKSVHDYFVAEHDLRHGERGGRPRLGHALGLPVQHAATWLDQVVSVVADGHPMLVDDSQLPFMNAMRVHIATSALARHGIPARQDASTLDAVMHQQWSVLASIRIPSLSHEAARRSDRIGTFLERLGELLEELEGRQLAEVLAAVLRAEAGSTALRSVEHQARRDAAALAERWCPASPDAVRCVEMSLLELAWGGPHPDRLRLVVHRPTDDDGQMPFRPVWKRLTGMDLGPALPLESFA